MLRSLAPHCLFLTVYHSAMLAQFIPDSSWHRVLLESLSFTFLKLFPVHAGGHLIPLMVQVRVRHERPRKCVTSPKALAPRHGQTKSTLAILSIVDSLIKKYLCNRCKFRAGKTLPGSSRNRFRRVSLDAHQIWFCCLQARPLIQLRNKSLHWIYKGSWARAHGAHEPRLHTHQHTPSVCDGGCQNM